MPTPWIPRIFLTLLGVQVGICTAFLADEWAPLKQREETAFRSIIDSDGLAHIIDPSAAVDRTRVVRPLKSGQPSNYLRIDITKDKERFFETFPPSPTDWSLILKAARSEPPGVAAIDYPLTWENAGELSLDTLDHELSLYRHAVLCVDLRRAPVGQPLPDYMRRRAIPIKNLSNTDVALPHVNRLVFPPSATGAENILFSFRTLESEQSGGKMPPAFARWDDVLIPSFPIALAMAQHDVDPADVLITLGSHVRLGNGPIIPLDEFGHIQLPQGEHNHITLPPPGQRNNTFTTANDIVDGDFSYSLINNNPPDTTIFTDNTGLSTSPWGDPRTLQNVISAVDTLPRPGAPEVHPRFPHWLETLSLIILATLGAASFTLRPLLRNLAYPLLALCGLAAAAAAPHLHGSWTPFTPILACTLGAWLLSSFLHTFLHQPAPQVSPPGTADL